MKNKRGKNVRKLRAKQSAESTEITSAPHSIIYAHAGVGKYLKSLQTDLRCIFEPFTAKDFVFKRKNTFKDVLGLAARFHVSHIITLTHTKPQERGDNISDTASVISNATVNSAVSSSNSTIANLLASSNVNMHIVRVPEGPRLTFRIKEYSLRSDMQNLIKTTMHLHGYTANPPLVMCQGFSQPPLSQAEMNALSSEDKEIWKTKNRMLQLLAETFRSLVPPLNVQQFKAKNLKRILLISREEDASGSGEDLIYLRHYRITTQAKGVSRPVRKLVMSLVKGGASGGSKTVPDLSHCKTMVDFVSNPYGPDSEMSDFEVTSENEIELNDITAEIADLNNKANKKSTASDATSNASTSGSVMKHAVRLIELGPRLTIQLIKVEQGTTDGEVLYHRYIHRTVEERLAQEAKVKAKQAIKQQRLAEQKKRLAAKIAAAESKPQRKRRLTKNSESGGKKVRFSDDKSANKNDEDSS